MSDEAYLGWAYVIAEQVLDEYAEVRDMASVPQSRVPLRDLARLAQLAQELIRAEREIQEEAKIRHTDSRLYS